MKARLARWLRRLADVFEKMEGGYVVPTRPTEERPANHMLGGAWR